MNPLKLLFGLIIVTIGVIFLGINAGWWNNSIWDAAVQFWPLLLILVGLWLVLRNVTTFLIITLILLAGIGYALARHRITLSNSTNSSPNTNFLPAVPSNETSTFTEEVTATPTDLFTAHLSGRYDIKIVGDSGTSIRTNLSGPKTLIDSLRLTKSGNEIVLDESQPGFRLGIFRGLSTITGTITIPNSLALSMKLSGFNQLSIENHTGKITLDNSGSATANFVNTTSFDPNIDISGSGKINLDQCKGVGTVTVSGSGDVTATNCTLDQLTIQSSGSGSVTIKQGSIKDLKVHTSGSSRIMVPKPTGSIEQSNSGSSTINYNQ